MRHPENAAVVTLLTSAPPEYQCNADDSWGKPPIVWRSDYNRAGGGRAGTQRRWRSRRRWCRCCVDACLPPAPLETDFCPSLTASPCATLLSWLLPLCLCCSPGPDCCCGCGFCSVLVQFSLRFSVSEQCQCCNALVDGCPRGSRMPRTGTYSRFPRG